VSDCTGEGLKALLSLHEHCAWLAEPVSDRRLEQAVDCVSQLYLLPCDLCLLRAGRLIIVFTLSVLFAVYSIKLRCFSLSAQDIHNM